MNITLNYGVTFGKGDSSDVMEWDVELEEKEEKLYTRARMTGKDFEDIPELKAVLDEVYDDVAAEELDSLRWMDDEFTKECLGEVEMDPDQLNELVHAADPYALSFFGLEEATEEELAEWDAYDLDDIPYICVFQDDFEPKSPFDNGWELNVWFPFNDECPEDQEFEEFLTEVLTAGDVEAAEETVAYWEDWNDELRAMAYRIAEKVGCREYLSAHEEDAENVESREE